MNEPETSVTFLTGTYNKGILLSHSAESLWAQSCPKWEWWVVLNAPDAATEVIALKLETMDKRIKVFYYPCKESERTVKYLPCCISNLYIPKITSKYFTWLSDDDCLQPCFVEVLAGELDKNPDWDVVFGSVDGVVTNLDGEVLAHRGWIHANNPIGKGTGINPDCLIDGGQILQTKRSWDHLYSTGYRFPEEWHVASHADGVYMSNLASLYTFYPVPHHVLTHRRTPVSTFQKD